MTQASVPQVDGGGISDQPVVIALQPVEKAKLP